MAVRKQRDRMFHPFRLRVKEGYFLSEDGERVALDCSWINSISSLDRRSWLLINPGHGLPRHGFSSLCLFFCQSLHKTQDWFSRFLLLLFGTWSAGTTHSSLTGNFALDRLALGFFFFYLLFNMTAIHRNHTNHVNDSFFCSGSKHKSVFLLDFVGNNSFAWEF